VGEKIVRECPMAEGVKVSLSDVKDEIIIQGNDIQSVSQSAAAITDKCRVKDKDIRKFLDGESSQPLGSYYNSTNTNIRCLHVAKDDCCH
jgi:ribosomal protein L6P/L9E